MSSILNPNIKLSIVNPPVAESQYKFTTIRVVSKWYVNHKSIVHLNQ